MKKSLIAIALLIAGVSFGQQPEKGAHAKEKVKKEVSKNMKEQKQEHKEDKEKGNAEQHGHGDKDMHTDKGAKEHMEHSEHQDHMNNHPEMHDDMHKEKDNNGQGHAYGKNKGDLSGREFGMVRAGKAVSGDEIKSDEQAKEIITDVKEENKTVITGVKSKLEKAAEELAKKKEAGEISEDEFMVKSTALELLKKREEALKQKVMDADAK